MEMSPTKSNDPSASHRLCQIEELGGVDAFLDSGPLYQYKITLVWKLDLNLQRQTVCKQCPKPGRTSSIRRVASCLSQPDSSDGGLIPLVSTIIIRRLRRELGGIDTRFLDFLLHFEETPRLEDGKHDGGEESSPDKDSDPTHHIRDELFPD